MLKNEDRVLEGLDFIDLFSGIGGFRLAMESCGAKCLFSSEIDSIAAQVYRENYGDLAAGDITKVPESSIPYHDILCAGFPCQPFSISGKQMGFDDTRGSLFFDIARIVKAKRPRVVLLENVKNFIRHNKGNTLALVKITMEELGYSFFYKVLNSTEYNIPQYRERVYIVCFRRDIEVDKFSFPEKTGLKVHLEDILIKDEEIVKNLFVDRSDIFLRKSERLLSYSDKPLQVGIVNKGGQGERIYSPKGVSITLSAYGGGVFAKTGGYLINGRIRKLHPKECASLMGFPPSFKMNVSDSQAYKLFGNAVVVDVIQHIAHQIAKVLDSRSPRPCRQKQSRLFAEVK